MSQIIVEVGKQMDGATFQLSPQTRALLSLQTGGQVPAASVFVSYAQRKDLEAMHGPAWQHIVALLTGLTDEQIREMGFSVINPTDSRILFDSGSD